MRWAERGPTPGSARRASIRRSRPRELGTGSRVTAVQKGSLSPGGKPMPAVTLPIFSATVASARCAASL